MSQSLVHLSSTVEEPTGLKPNSERWPRHGLSPLVCQQCFVKLNRLHKVQLELETRLERLYAEKEALVKALSIRSEIKTVSTPPETPVKHKATIL